MRRGMALVVLMLLVPLATFQAGAPADKKLPIPSEKSQASVMKLIKELYEAEMDKAEKDPQAMSRLAAQFLQEARDTNDNSTGRYLLLVLAADFAARGGDAPVALQAIEEKAQRFQIGADELLKAKIDALFTAAKSGTGKDSAQVVLDSALVLLEEALANDDFPASVRLVKAAEAAAIKLRSVPTLAAVRKRQDEVLRLEKAFARWKPFADTLAKNPDDAEANREMGMYHAFLKGNWERGLPLLARSGAPVLKDLATADMQQPTDAAAQIKLGRAWEQIARDVLKEPLRTQVLLHAYSWYQQALGDADPNMRSKLEAAMTAIMEQVPPEYRVGEIAVEVRKLDGHSGPIYDAAFSPDGKKIVSGGADTALHLWDVRTGKELRRLDGSSGRIWTVNFAPDGRRLISGGFDSALRLWDLASGREVRRLEGPTDYVRSAVFSRDGRLVLSGGDDRLVRLFSVESGKEIMTFSGHNHFVWSVDLSRDGKRALSGSLDKTVRLWDVKSGQPMHVLKGHKDTVLSVAFAPDGRRAISGSTDKTLVVWDLETGQPMHTLAGHKGFVNSVAFSPDGRRALSGSQDGTVRLWDVYEGKELKILTGHNDQVWSVAFSRDGRLALSTGQDGTIRIWGGTK